MSRILYFSRDYTPHDHRFLTALAETDHEIGYLRLERRGHRKEIRLLPENITLIPWTGGHSQARFRDVFRLLSALKKTIRDFKPELIHAGPLQRTALLVALTGFRPLISMSWGYDLLVDAHRSRWWAWATRFTLNRSAAMVGDCDTVRKLAVHYGMDSDRIITFPWGVDLRQFYPLESSSQKFSSKTLRAQLDWGENIFVLLSTRTWSPLYGVEDLARAFVQAARKHPQLRLLMLGDGPLAPTIRRIFEKNKLSHRVHFPGQVASEDLRKYYQAADLYISTSHSDGTSISLLESLACGTPVLITDIPGNREWITNPGQVGWLFSDGNIEALSEGIMHAVEHRTKLPNMGQAGRQLVESRADWDKNFLQLLHAYKIALGKANAEI